MDSITTAGGLASEKFQSVPSAASPKPTETCVPAAEGLLQPMQHRENREAVMTHHLAKLDVALDSPEAADAGGQAESTEDECSPTNDIKDDVSIDSAVLVAERRWLLDGQLDGAKEEHDPTIAWALGPDKRKGTKYARVAAIYTESLEYRVSALETELLKLQYEIGSKERPGEERQVMRSIFNLNEYRVLVLILVSCRDDDTPTPNSPCADPVPLKVMLLSMKDWKNGRHHAKWDKAPIFLATTTERPSVQLETTHPDTHSQGPDHDKGVTYYKDDLVADVRRPGLSDVARLMFASPWPLILIELLSGEHINTGETWIYPFKHIVVYEKQIRKFLELLNETNVDDLEVNNLSHTLNMIISKVVRDLGPKRDDVEYSEAYVSIILQTWRHELKNHHLRVRQSSPEDQEKELEEDTKAEPGLSSISSTDGTCTKVSEPSNLAPEAYPVQEAIPYMCTCLKDARDHMQLLVNMIDSHLGSLLTLHEAVRDRAISKIRFEHLWHLFQPGDLVVTSKQPHQAYRVIHVSGGRPLLMTTDIASGDQDAKAKPPFRRQAQVSPFNIDCVRIDFDGEKFGPVQETFRIFEYEEDRVITRLELYPMSYAEFPEGLAQTLLDRGRRFAEYRLFKHKRYEGLSLSEPQEEVKNP